MWVEEIRLENIRCFEDVSIKLGKGGKPYPWVTLLSENAGGKTTVLQSMALLLAGHEGALTLMPRSEGWLRDPARIGKIALRIHQDKHDLGKAGEKKVTTAFGYTFNFVGPNLTVRGKKYHEPIIAPDYSQKNVGFLRENVFSSVGQGWFAAGYGAFRRLTRETKIIVPDLAPQARYTNFITQFNESEPLSALENVLAHLEFRIAKDGDNEAKRHRDIGIETMNRLLPDLVRFSDITSSGTVLFSVGGTKVPTTGLSDGFRSILALAGDLFWRMVKAFPQSDDPLKETGVVLIDELDIHLHPTWQRYIAWWLQRQFPKIQFIVSTHSPFIAAGAGEDAKTYRLIYQDGKTIIKEAPKIFQFDVEGVLQSYAFGLVSTYSPQVEEKIKRYDELASAGSSRTAGENSELKKLSEELGQAVLPITGNSLEARMNRFILEKMNDSR